jgi:hypothetical protein
LNPSGAGGLTDADKAAAIAQEQAEAAMQQGTNRATQNSQPAHKPASRRSGSAGQHSNGME